MPTADHAPPGARFFARVHDFEFLCPLCGQLSGRRHGRRFELFYGRVQCQGCKRWYGTGLLLWRLARSGGTALPQTPDDWRPTGPELAALRRLEYESGLTPAQRLHAASAPQNVAVLAVCRCVGGWDKACPAHGEAPIGDAGAWPYEQPDE